MKGRKPRQDELELWSQVAQGVSPMHAQPEAGVDEQVFQKHTKPERKFEKISLPQIGSRAVPLKDDLASSIEVNLASQPVQMDRKAFKNLQRGKLKPDARIDLHGMTLDRAHSALTRFVLSAHGSGKRLLLVITGKGKQRDEGGPIPTRFGVLRHQVPEWLRLPPLSHAVLQVSQAHVSHGGGGAYYVYLRRSR